MRVVQMQAVLRKLSKGVLLFAVLSALGATPALADSITVDENANGFYTFSHPGFTPIPIRSTPSGHSSLMLSPSPAQRAVSSSPLVQERVFAQRFLRPGLPAVMSLLS